MKKNLLFSALSLAILALAWVAVYFIVRNDGIVPSLWDTFAAAGREFGSAAFWRGFAFTLLRDLAAFALAFLMGAGLAALAALSGKARALIAPVVSVFRSAPTIAVTLILLAWAVRYPSLYSTAPIIVALLVLLPTLYAAMLASVDEVRAEYGEFASVFGVSAKNQLFKMYVPLAAPPVLAQCGPILSLGLKITVSGEILARTYRSIGGLMQTAQLELQMASLFALTLIVVVIGFALEGAGYLLYRFAERRLK